MSRTRYNHAGRYTSVRRDPKITFQLSTIAGLVAAVLFVSNSPALSQSATWLTNPGSGDYNTAANWTPATVPSGTGTATFGTSSRTTLTFSSFAIIGGWTFNVGASAYTFNSSTLTFQGAGIVINGGSANITNTSSLTFTNASTSGTASITNQAFVDFNDTSTADSAIISGGNIRFSNTSTAGNATLSNINNADFFHSSTAGAATISVNNLLQFRGSSTAGTANITTSGTTNFFDNSTGGQAHFTVNSSGTLNFQDSSGLTGNGQITAGSIAAAGAVKIGSNTLSVAGNANFSGGSSYGLSISPATSGAPSGILTAAGASTLTGGTVTVSTSAGNYTPVSYTILVAAGGVTGTFSNLDILGDFGPLVRNPHLVYDANNVRLVLDRAFLADQPSALANANQFAVATAIDNAASITIGNGTTLSTAFNRLLGLTGSRLADALAQVSGQPGATTAQSGLQATNSFMTLMFNPFAGGRSFGGGANFGSSNAYAAEQRLSDKAKNAYAAVTPKSTVADAIFGGDRLSLWASGYGGSGSINGNAAAGTQTTATRVSGFAAGADYRVSGDTTAGFALAGGGTSWHLDAGLGGGRSDIFQAGIYGTHRRGAAYLSGGLTYGAHWTSTERVVTVSGTDKLAADFLAHSFGARIEGGYRFILPPFGLTPYAAAQWQSFHTPTYSEQAISGADSFALTYTSNSTNNIRTETGAWLDREFNIDASKKLLLRGRIAWAHDSDTTSSISVVFQTLPGSHFTVNGAQPSPDAALVSAGGQLKLVTGWTLGAQFDGEFSSTTALYAATGTVRRVW